jgi:hypothetical protein
MILSICTRKGNKGDYGKGVYNFSSKDATILQMVRKRQPESRESAMRVLRLIMMLPINMIQVGDRMRGRKGEKEKKNMQCQIKKMSLHRWKETEKEYRRFNAVVAGYERLSFGWRCSSEKCKRPTTHG